VRYRAFLSYSHVDAHWARWLLRRLESYRVPSRLVGTAGRDGPIPARLGPLFRDRDELPTAGDLSTTIREALADSATLVVICSPAAAQSKWVDAEVQAFRARHGGDRVFCFVVDGEPARGDCFPPSLLTPDAEGHVREPLAADARKDGDGKDRAALKLIAGLLGVGFDTLVQREAQRRNKRMAIVAAASVAGMALTSTLAISAYVARNDAQRRQVQAEDLLDFMMGDLREKLTTVGRLDLMRSVDAKATKYFATLDPRDLSDHTLEEQARSLTGIGQVRLEEGNHPAAAAAFREAYVRSSALYDRKPSDGQRLFDRAQAEYWIGYVAWQQDRFDDAEKWLTQYRDSALKLAAMDRKNFDWQKEVAYGHHNLAVLDEARGQHAKAEQAMLQELDLFRGWVRARPNDLPLRSEKATVVSWLGSNALQQGRLQESEGWFADALADMDTLRTQAPKDNRWREDWVDQQLLLADVRSQRGRMDEARAAVEAANREADAMVRQDPDNKKWASVHAVARFWRAQLDAESPPVAMPEAAEAERLLTAVHAAEPKDMRMRQWLGRARLLQARMAFQQHDDATAHERIASTHAVIDPGWKSGEGEALRVTLAELQTLEGEVAKRAGDDATATSRWRDAQALLLAGKDPDGPPFSRLDPLVRTLHHLEQDDAAMPYRQRLVAAAYVPIDPLPPLPGIAAR